MGSPHLVTMPRPKRLKFTRCMVGIFAVVFLLVTYRNVFTVSSRAGKIQYPGFRGRAPQKARQLDRQKAVRKEFLHAWYGYKDHSWMADSLMSLTGSGKDQFCGWSATLVDALDTLWIMDLKEEFDEAVEATVGIDFAHTAVTCRINLFESTIRYLGGMLAAYDLSGDQRLLPKLIELGDILYGQFRTTNGMPCNHCSLILTNETVTPGPNVPLADVGSFYLEFGRLSQITGDKKYMALVAFLTNVFESTQNSSSIPGLWPERVDAAAINGSLPEFATKSFTYSLGALSDSAYEYLVKGHLLLGGLTTKYASMWFKAAEAIRQNLLFRALIPQWDKTDVLFSGLATKYYPIDELWFEARIQHLGCFAGGMFAMSSKIFDIPADLTIGKQLTQGCVWAYENAPIGIMPETLTLVHCPKLGGPQCEWNRTAWDEAGEYGTYGYLMRNEEYPLGYLSSIDTKYLLRPEAIESVFILYRITGDEYYRDAGWRMFRNIIKHTRTPYGHASLQDVMTTLRREVYDTQTGEYTSVDMAAQSDDMESFWLAETLKYFWLLFAEPTLISLDEWVLNTEAHPLKLTRGSRGF